MLRWLAASPAVVSCLSSLRSAASAAMSTSSAVRRGRRASAFAAPLPAGEYRRGSPSSCRVGASLSSFARLSSSSAAAACAARERQSSPLMLAAQLIDGKATAAAVRSEIGAEVRALKELHGVVPGLAVVIVGARRDSQTYVRNKRRACADVGMQSFLFELAEDVKQRELEEKVRALNGRDDVHGILVQLPLPRHIDERAVLELVSVEKDVDGFHPTNMARLLLNDRRRPFSVPCTPRGCMELLSRSGVQLEGKNAVVLGRSSVVGIPMAMLLMQSNATVTVCHSRTRDLVDKLRDADIVVAAIGRPELVLGEWIKQGAVVIDVGINAVDDPSDKRGYRLVGDVQFDTARSRASYITPVPGGVGPMTIAMLLRNTLDAARAAAGV